MEWFRRTVFLSFSLLILAGSMTFIGRSLITAEVNEDETVSPRPQKFKSDSNQPDVNSIFQQINEVRKSHGLQPLVPNTQLTLLAQNRAGDMAANGYYGHKNPNGKFFYDLMRQSNYDVEYGCENLDLQFTLWPSIYVRDWLESKKGHRECVLDERVSEAGYAVTQVPVMGGEEIPTYVVVAIHSTPPRER